MVKKRHCRKWLLITNRNKKILFIGEMTSGKVHDFTMFKNSLKFYDFSKLTLWVDLGFLGIHKHILAKKINIPYKATKKHPLTEQQKEINKTISSTRVKIENAIAGIKRYFILVNKSRMRIQTKLDDAMNICSNLWNLLLKFRNTLIIR